MFRKETQIKSADRLVCAFLRIIYIIFYQSVVMVAIPDDISSSGSIAVSGRGLTGSVTITVFVVIATIIAAIMGMNALFRTTCHRTDGVLRDCFGYRVGIGVCVSRSIGV